MSIFSRLFNKGQGGEEEKGASEAEEHAANEQAAAAAPSTAAGAAPGAAGAGASPAGGAGPGASASSPQAAQPAQAAAPPPPKRAQVAPAQHGTLPRASAPGFPAPPKTSPGGGSGPASRKAPPPLPSSPNGGPVSTPGMPAAAAGPSVGGPVAERRPRDSTSDGMPDEPTHDLTPHVDAVVRRPAIDPPMFKPRPPTTTIAGGPASGVPPVRPPMGSSSAITVTGVPALPFGEGPERETKRARFVELALTHLKVVRELAEQLRTGGARPPSLEPYEKTLRKLRRAAEAVNLPELCEALDRLSAALGDAFAGGGPSIAEGDRERLVVAYQRVVDALPGAHADDELAPVTTESLAATGPAGFSATAPSTKVSSRVVDEGAAAGAGSLVATGQNPAANAAAPSAVAGASNEPREAIVVRAVLRDVPGLARTTLDRLVASGRATLDALFAASVDDVVAACGAPREVAARVVARAKQLEKDASRVADRTRLASELNSLVKVHGDYEKVAESWSEGDEAKKRELRAARAEGFLRVQVILARLGAVEQVHEIERLPFGRKLETLQRYVKETRNA